MAVRVVREQLRAAEKGARSSLGDTCGAKRERWDMGGKVGGGVKQDGEQSADLRVENT